MIAAALTVVVFARTAAAEEATVSAATEVAAYHDSTATSVLTPSAQIGVELPDTGLALDAGYLADVVTAASPDVIATASPRWEEVRHAVDLGVRYAPDQWGLGLSGALSTTPDYLSLGGRAIGSYETADQNASAWLGASFHRDVIGRTGTSFDALSRTLDQYGALAGLTLTVNRSAILSLVADGSFEHGDASKPYRYIPLFSREDAEALEPGAGATRVAQARIDTRPLEQLPLTRARGSLTLRLGWRWPGVTLRLEERAYADSWRLLATTTDLRLPCDAHERVRLWPQLRVHAQTGVSFWQRAYVADGPGEVPALRTGDREHGPLVNASLGAGVRVALGPDSDPESGALSLSGLGTLSHFFDALYLLDRYSVLVALGGEARF